MERSTDEYPRLSFVKLAKKEIWLACLVLFIGLAIGQDFLFSHFQNTGFYFSESLLYNSIWIFLFPLLWLAIRWQERIAVSSKMTRFLLVFALGAAFSLVHILVFASFFVGVSYFVFTPTHRFSAIFNAALSNQLYIIFGVYTLVPLLYHRVKNMLHQSEASTIKYPVQIKVKTGGETAIIATHDIQVISTDKPYSAIFVHAKKYLDHRTLRDFEGLLNPERFLRVHRSAIINVAYLKTLTSRQNGDYDVLLQNGQSVRLSRHYRANWQQLLH